MMSYYISHLVIAMVFFFFKNKLLLIYQRSLEG